MDLFSRTCLDLGSSFILIKRDWIISSRLALYGLSLLLFFITDWLQKFVKDSKEKWKFIATSMFGTFIPAFFAIAQTEIDSSVTSILNS
jgi:hypothetical protein